MHERQVLVLKALLVPVSRGETTSWSASSEGQGAAARIGSASSWSAPATGPYSQGAPGACFKGCIMKEKSTLRPALLAIPCFKAGSVPASTHPKPLPEPSPPGHAVLFVDTISTPAATLHHLLSPSHPTVLRCPPRITPTIKPTSACCARRGTS